MIGMKIFYHKKGEKNMVKREDLYGIAYYKKAVYYGSTKPDLRFRIAWNKKGAFGELQLSLSFVS